MSITIQELLQIKMDLRVRKSKFDKYRVSNIKSVDEVNNVISENRVTNDVDDNKSKNVDLVAAVKTYTEKIKYGYFGKKVRGV